MRKVVSMCSPRGKTTAEYPVQKSCKSHEKSKLLRKILSHVDKNHKKSWENYEKSRKLRKKNTKKSIENQNLVTPIFQVAFPSVYLTFYTKRKKRPIPYGYTSGYFMEFSRLTPPRYHAASRTMIIHKILRQV